MLKSFPLSETGKNKPEELWGRGVAANMRPCQGRDRGFEPRRSRKNDLHFSGHFFFNSTFILVFRPLS